MTQILTKKTYKSVFDSLQLLPFRNRIKALKIMFPDISVNTLKCIIAQDCQRRMKHLHGRLTSAEAVEDIYAKFLESVSKEEEPGILLRLSDETGLTPALLTRTLIERHHQRPDQSKPSRCLVSSLMKNTALIQDRDLAFESYLCLLDDDHYGPVAEAMKQSIGYEYEIRLRRELQDANVVFLHEDDLRTRGYDKTPDIKLEIPVAVGGQVINWIESKALFGDEEIHRGYLKDQLYSYWNRFGPGLVIYWFGYVEELESLHQDRTILIRDSLPTNLGLMDLTNT
uniref:CDAN1-interacting nuclease 1 n=1 Tax=Evadne anonyx TaxID=141404 RepID=A0A9N6WXX9_9CRUS|nr:EOG090X0A0V [Evadne anonyx]